MGSISKKWMVFWITLFSLIMAAMIVLLTTDFGGDVMNALAEKIAGIINMIKRSNAASPWKKMVGDGNGRGSSAYEENDYGDQGGD